MNNKKTIITIIIVLTIVFAIIGATFAYWSWASDNANKTNVTFTIAADFSCGINGEGNITGANLAPASCTNSTYAIQRAITTTITNNGSDPVSMDMWLKVNSIGSGLSGTSNFKWALTTDSTSCTNNEVSHGSFQGKTSNSTITLFTGETNTATYYLYIWLDSAETSTATQNQSFSISIGGACTNEVVTSGLPDFIVNSNAPLDSVSSTYVSSNTGIDFDAPSGSTNGRGLYIRTGTQNDTNPIYYYRGAVDNNNVLFANYCWKIIRTTETGGLKLIYNGAPSNGNCGTGTTSQVNSNIGTGAFNTNYDDSKYVGYMYSSGGTMTNSTIKTAIDNWYMASLSSYESYLEDTIYCNDMSVATQSETNQLIDYMSNYDSGDDVTFYGSFVRAALASTPNLACPNNADAYTVSDTVNGNGLLTYPIGMMTLDELSLAGVGFENFNYGDWEWLSEDNNYLDYNYNKWWTMSPISYDNIYSSSPSVLFWGGGDSYYNVVSNTSNYIRPVISLKSGLSFASGNGLGTNPYRF